MSEFRWEHSDVNSGADDLRDPYTKWFTEIAPLYEPVFPGDVADRENFWIIDNTSECDPGAPWSPASAAKHLKYLEIKMVEPDGVYGKDWHAAPLRPESVPASRALGDIPSCELPIESGSTAPVIVAVIDDAINFAHTRFQSSGAESRVDYAWVMDGTHRPPDNHAGSPVSSAVPFGREWTRNDIESAIDEAHGDETDLLRRLELCDFQQSETIALSKRISHGTHVLDIAAGFDPNDLAGRDCRIISVQLPRGVVRETSGALLPLFLKSAALYIESRAREIAHAYIRRRSESTRNAGAADTQVPLLVNISYGLAAGGHNGRHPIEVDLEEVLSNRDANDRVNPVHVVLPAGNRFRAQGHASARAESAGRRVLELEWMIPAGDRSPNFLEIWLPADAGETEIHIVPAGQEYGISSEVNGRSGSLLLRTKPNGVGTRRDTVAWACVHTVDEPGQDGTKQKRILAAVAPTEYPRSNVAVAPAGLWKLKVEADLQPGQSINAWIQRDDRPYGYRRPGRQSYFVDSTATAEKTLSRELNEYSELPSRSGEITGYGSLNGIATNDHLDVVAGYRWRDQMPAIYSAAGSESVVAPSYSAVTDRSRVVRGVLAAGSRSGSMVALNGTSVAVPQIVRALADSLRNPAARFSTSAPDAINRRLPQEREAERLRGRQKLLSPSSDLEKQFKRSWREDRLVRDENAWLNVE